MDCEYSSYITVEIEWCKIEEKREYVFALGTVSADFRLFEQTSENLPFNDKNTQSAHQRQHNGYKFALDLKHLFSWRTARGLIDKVNTIYANYT